MSTTRGKFIDRCMDIVNARPDYFLGCSSKEKCDCIGMIKYSLRENGVSFSTSGTNWTIRNHVNNIRQITGASVLKAGDVVFKAKNPGDSGYNLPAKYRTGGSAYNGDLHDYCHIGVVKSVNPLRIIHMTSPTAKTDTTIGKWKVAADLKPEYISDTQTGTPQAKPEPTAGTVTHPQSQENNQNVFDTPETGDANQIMTVWANNGKPVKMRSKPTTSCKLYENIPCGAEIEVNALNVTTDSAGHRWSKVSYGKRKGWYMMTEYLGVG